MTDFATLSIFCCMRDSGGGSVTVTGAGLDVVNDPKMTTTIVISSAAGDPDEESTIETVRVVTKYLILGLFGSFVHRFCTCN